MSVKLNSKDNCYFLSEPNLKSRETQNVKTLVQKLKEK